MDTKSLLKRDSRNSICFSPLGNQKLEYLLQKNSRDLEYQIAWLNHHMQHIIIGICYYCCTALMVSATLIHYQSYPIMVRVAKSAAMGINVNLGIIAIPVAKNLISSLRASIFRHFLPLKQAMFVHNMAGYHILYFSIVHVAAHCLNYLDIAKVYGDLNDFKPESLLLTTLPGYTGLTLSLLLFLMMTAIPTRKHNFEIFYYSHKLAIPIMIISLFHGVGCFVNQFIGMKCHYYAYKFVPWSLGIYLIELVIVKLFQRAPALIKSYKWISNDTMELVLSPSSILTREPGSYVFLNCPQISKYQNHPFTLTNPRDKANLTLEIKAVGDWTNNLTHLIEFEMDQLIVEGPYNSTSVDLKSFNTLILIGQGIGVTPFKAMIQQVIMDYENNMTAIPRIELVTLYKNEEDRTEIMESDEFQLPHINISSYTKSKCWPPKFDEIFSNVHHSSRNQSVGVFVCGSDCLGNLIEQMCLEYSRDERQFIYTNESF